jgi:serine/threonine protein kinase
MGADRKINAVDYDTKPGGVSPHRRRVRQAQQIPRSIRLLITTIVVLCAVAGLLRGLGDLHDQGVKRLPTDFSTHVYEDKLWAPDRPVRYDNGTNIDKRYTFLRHIGRGQEGSVDLYVDELSGDTVVVKQMSIAARNQIPATLLGDFIQLTSTWPTEIEAGLLLADDDGEGPYVRILDYFVLQSPSGWSWAMVSPFVSGGTLLSLAGAERKRHGRTIHELDREYRPMFEDLLEGVQSLHSKGLCHNDVKPNNIFVRNSSSWLLGDLGNVRHFQHSWHFTASWVRQNQWQDCQLNDVRRFLKTYLSFLRAASPDEDAFDDQFWHRRTAWSAMFWDFQDHPVGAARLTALSRKLYKPREPDRNSDGPKRDPLRVGRMAIATEKELLCTTIPSKWWLVGRPV